MKMLCIGQLPTCPSLCVFHHAHICCREKELKKILEEEIQLIDDKRKRKFKRMNKEEINETLIKNGKGTTKIHKKLFEKN